MKFLGHDSGSQSQVFANLGDLGQSSGAPDCLPGAPELPTQANYLERPGSARSHNGETPSDFLSTLTPRTRALMERYNILEEQPEENEASGPSAPSTSRGASLSELLVEQDLRRERPRSDDSEAETTILPRATHVTLSTQQDEVFALANDIAEKTSEKVTATVDAKNRDRGVSKTQGAGKVAKSSAAVFPATDKRRRDLPTVATSPSESTSTDHSGDSERAQFSQLQGEGVVRSLANSPVQRGPSASSPDLRSRRTSVTRGSVRQRPKILPSADLRKLFIGQNPCIEYTVVPDDHHDFPSVSGIICSEDHVKVLYLVSLYAVEALRAQDKESWIRSMPLLVLLYECIVAGAIDFDYGPKSELISYGGESRRVWMNITQEGKAAVDDLREYGFLNGLKLSTEDFQPVTAFQVSRRGLRFLKQVRTVYQAEIIAPVNRVAFHHKELLVARWDTDHFGLYTKDGAARVSTVTECEDISYVSSPYLPQSVREPSAVSVCTDNSTRAHESASGESNIRDDLDEVVHLDNVRILISEWIPFGSNQIVALNERLGSMDRCQGGLFTALVDTDPTDTQFFVAPGLTKVTILDYDLINFINFEAEINYPEDEGIVQVENFGMHINGNGTILYGMRVEAVLDRVRENISIDHLARLLVDAHQDTSRIINDLLSAYQRSVLDMIFSGDTANRSKYNIVIADSITPLLDGPDYLDRGSCENELKQILGEVHAAVEVVPRNILIVGRDGLLLTGPRSSEFEKILVVYAALTCREQFLRNYFVRMFVLSDLMKRTRQMIMTHERDPNSIPKIRGLLSTASQDIILLEEAIEYMKESLDELPDVVVPELEGGQALCDILGVCDMRDAVKVRVRDLIKLLVGATHELHNLQQMTDVINSKQTEDIFKNVESNTKYLVDASAAQERSSNSLFVMQIILAGSFAFDIVDRVVGGNLNADLPEWAQTYIYQPLIADVPGLWFVINMLWLILVSVLLMKLMNFLSERAQGVLTLKRKMNIPIDVKCLNVYLESKVLEVSDTFAEERQDLRKTRWDESDVSLWKGSPPKVEIVYDSQYGYLLYVTFQVDKKRSKLDEQGLVEVFLGQLRLHSVLRAEQVDHLVQKALRSLSGIDEQANAR